jgi:tripartite-type tricarboxylate transporter receptor subunit TctC
MLTGGMYDLPFDLLADLDPVIMIGSEPLLIVAKKDLPASNLKELIAWLKANPGKASVGIAGVGATGHLAGIAFQKETGTSFEFVPYRGNAPGRQALAAGQIDFMIEPSSNFPALVKAGTIKAIAVTSPDRVDSYPDTPTAMESGLLTLQASLWYGLWVRHGTPQVAIEKLNAAMRRTLADPEIAGKLATLGSGSHLRRSRRQTCCAHSRRRKPSLVANHQGGQHQAVIAHVDRRRVGRQ